MRAILDRYLITECLPTLGLSLAVFTFVLLMQRLLRLSDLVVAKGVPSRTCSASSGSPSPPSSPCSCP